ncbi:MAG: hypothetical protein AB1846_09870 [Chloroflexota bacterium]
MEVSQNESLPPPPGLIASLTAGFEAIASHVWVILLPVLLDVYFWLGPRLSLEKLVAPQIAKLPEMMDLLITGQPELLPAVPFSQERLAVEIAFLNEAFAHFNLFRSLRTLPVGISSLMAGRMPTLNPLGNLQVIDVASPETAFAWVLGLTLLGWIGGGLYYSQVAAILPSQTGPRPFVRDVIQTVLLSGIWTGLMIAASVPLFVMLWVIMLISPALTQLVLLIGLFLLSWLVLPVFFSPHGIFTRQETALESIRSSLRMVRFTLPTSTLFVMSIFILSQGLNLLWSVPDEASWMSLVGILGHAFVTTALLAASFIYYQDISAWLQLVLERLKTQQTSSVKI